MERNIKKVLGYGVDLLSLDEAVNLTMEKIKSSQGGQIVTINPEMIELANKTPEFAEVLQNADLVIPDGSGIKLALLFKGIKQQQVPGVDFAANMIKHCADEAYPIALIGTKEEIIQLTVKSLLEKHKDLNISYYRNGYFSSDEEDGIIEELKNSKPKFVLVALGAPKQEFFIKKCLTQMPDAIFIGVGGSFDVWSGKIKRAPMIFRKTGFEWFYRILIEPQRIKRIYKTLPLFLIKVIIEALKEKLAVPKGNK